MIKFFEILLLNLTCSLIVVKVDKNDLQNKNGKQEFYLFKIQHLVLLIQVTYGVGISEGLYLV